MNSKVLTIFYLNGESFKTSLVSRQGTLLEIRDKLKLDDDIRFLHSELIIEKEDEIDVILQDILTDKIVRLVQVFEIILLLDGKQFKTSYFSIGTTVEKARKGLNLNKKIKFQFNGVDIQLENESGILLIILCEGVNNINLKSQGEISQSQKSQKTQQIGESFKRENKEEQLSIHIFDRNYYVQEIKQEDQGNQFQDKQNLNLLLQVKNPQQFNEDSTNVKICSTSRNQNSKYKSGGYSNNEVETIMQSLLKCANEFQLTEGDLQQICTKSDGTKKFHMIWEQIAKDLPNRSIRSINELVLRKFNPANHLQAWMQQDENLLLDLVQSQGHRWTFISDILWRSPKNIRDKYINLQKRKFKHQPPSKPNQTKNFWKPLIEQFNKLYNQK